jgi:phosphoribosyl 1,2-cyclic phosphodiesterase
MFIASLNSGSNANCYYVGNEHEAVLIDTGLSCRETERRMRGLGLNMDKVKAIFISHEHSDHIRGLQRIAFKFQLPVYVTPATYGNGRLWVQQHLARGFIAHSPIMIGDLAVTAFPKQHDAADPHSFVVSCNGITVGVLTDIGLPCQHVINYFGQCHAAFLEANYDDDMLTNGKYPYHLKKRISSEHGHLSNAQAVDLFLRHRPPFMTHLLLSHLSKENNDPQLVHDLFTAHAGDTHVVVASRYEASAVYHITGQREAAPKVVQAVMFQ